MSSLNPQHGKTNSEEVLYAQLFGAVLFILGIAWATLVLTHKFTGQGGDIVLNPYELAINLITGDATWTMTATIVGACLFFGLVIAITVLGVLWGKRRRRGSKEDPAAAHMARKQDVERLTKEGRAADVKRLGGATTTPMLGKAVVLDKPIHGGMEDTCVAVYGPRMSKTTGLALPLIMEAPGVVLATSNKRDIVDLTRGPRAERGPVWVFDPQGIIGEPVSWYWDLLSYVTDGDPMMMDVRANALAQRFQFAARPEQSSTDAYFAPAGEKLLTQLILAAAVGRDYDRSIAAKGILVVREWVTNANTQEPVKHLRRAGYEDHAAGLAATINYSDKQKDGIYGTAEMVTSFLSFRVVRDWVTPGPGRVPFSPTEFVANGSMATLYSISREGMGSMGALVTALTAAVAEAAEALAERSPNGRLQVPMYLVLDEAANVCRWNDLPELFSHYGSKGILPTVFLQSPAQGQKVWGHAGFRILWGSSSLRLVGGGLDDTDFLRGVVAAVGRYSHTAYSTSSSQSGTSRSTSGTTDDILQVRDLVAMSGNRALLITSGVGATILEVVPSYKRKYARALEASQRQHSPNGLHTEDHTSEGRHVPSRLRTGPVPTVAPAQNNPWVNQ